MRKFCNSELLIYLCFFFCVSIANAKAMDSVKTKNDSVVTKLPDSTMIKLNKVIAFIDKQNKKYFYFGISFGLRTGFYREKTSRAVPFISPGDSLVQLDYNDISSFVVSTSITVYPFKEPFSINSLSILKYIPLLKSMKFPIYMGFTANINMVEFANQQVNTVFNKQVDGGMGIAFAFDAEKQFALGLTWERTSTIRPTDYVISREGKQIIGGNGIAITDLDIHDSRYFINSGLNAWAVKFIYQFK